MKHSLGKKILKQEFDRRKGVNTAYSLRAFAKYLGVGIATLSDTISGKRNLSKRNAQKIINKLNLSPQESNILLNESSKSYQEMAQELEKIQLKEDQFSLISNWYHSAIMELALVKGHKSSPTWIANKLGVSRDEVKAAISRLKKLGLLDTKNGQLIRCTPPLKTTTDIPSTAIRKHHMQIFDLAKGSIENDSVEERHFWDMTMAIDPKNLPKAKEMMVDAGRKIAKKLESGDQEEIYVLNMGLFPPKEGR